MAVLPPVLSPLEASFRAPCSFVGSVLDGSAELLVTALAGCDWLGALGVTVMTRVDGTGVSPGIDVVGVTRTVCTIVWDGGADGAVTVRTGEETAGGGWELGAGGGDDEAAGGGLEAGGGLDAGGWDEGGAGVGVDAGGAGDDWGASTEDGGLDEGGAGGDDAAGGVPGSTEAVTDGKGGEDEAAAGEFDRAGLEGATKEGSNVLAVLLLDMATADRSSAKKNQEKCGAQGDEATTRPEKRCRRGD